MKASSSSSSSTSLKSNTLRSALKCTLIAAAFLPSVSAQFPSLNTACTRHYTVEQGDTCDMIGQKTLTSTYQIMSLNLPQAGPDCYSLEPGQSLCLGRYGNDCQMVHRSTSSDTCDSITSQYGISTQTLLENNPTSDCGQIYDGLMLCVLNGLVRPPANPSLHLYHNAVMSSDKTYQMPLGQTITATNHTTTKRTTNELEEEEKRSYENVEEEAPIKRHPFKHGVNAHRSSY